MRRKPIDTYLKANTEIIPEVGEEEGIAKRLKVAAENSGITQVAIAKQLDMQHPSVNACSCVELEYSPIPDPACPLHGGE
jgi:hypothetical protein|tara:strand:- start:5 stop:244 length:240 start_codon:yes stop_codon:yes gene_type:complete